jgi:sRNA-binding carbon storage regulator CsrA
METTNHPVVLTDELTPEEVEVLDLKAEEIRLRIKAPKVHIYVHIEEDTKERITAFIKEPSFMQKVAMMDKISTAGAFVAGNELREACLIKEDSNPLTYGTGFECDKYRLGVNSACIKILDVAKNSFKKK